MNPSRKLAVATLIVAALSLDVVAVLAVPRIAGRVLRTDPASATLKAGRLAFASASKAARKAMITLAGDGLVAAAKGTSRVFAALHRLAPGERACTSCRVLVCGTNGIPTVGIAVVPCREVREVESQPTGPARLFSQTL